MPTLTESIQTYLAYLKVEKRLALNTLKSYELDCSTLVQLAEKFQFPAPSQWRASMSRRLVAELHAHGLNAKSIARKLSCWRGLFEHLIEHQFLTINPFDNVKAPRKARNLPKALNIEQANFLVESEVGKAEISHCNRAMFELCYSSGLRVSELASLDIRAFNSSDYRSVSWINSEFDEVYVTGKGSKARTVPVGDQAKLAVLAWLSTREKLIQRYADADQHALFLSQRGQRIAVRTIQRRLEVHSQQIGMDVHVHPHVLRHSFASHVLQSSGDLRAVQEMLGHQSIAATQIYTALDFQHLAKVYDQTHPRAKKK